MSKSYTLDSLFGTFPGGIIVPRIQRGYVQGRDDNKGLGIRANFVPVLVSAAFGGKELALDFIYGIARDDGAGMRCLHPLDGQQRLTTLFLLANASARPRMMQFTTIRGTYRPRDLFRSGR